MKRRTFLTSTGTGAAALSTASISTQLAPQAAGAAKKPVLFKLGCQSGPTDEKRLQFFARHSVKNICGYGPQLPPDRGYYTAEELMQLQERANKWGIHVDVLAPPLLSSSHIDREKRPAIMLGESPQRDKDIDDIHKMIEACKKADIGGLKYNMSILGVLRTERTPGRGGSTLSTWRLKEAVPKTPLTRAGKVNDEQAWERITYYLDHVIPVAKENKIKMQCHPHDPGVPPEGYQGVVRVLGTVDGLKKFVSIQESPYHGLNFCQGTVSEMLQDPGKEIYDVIRYFGSRKKIFNVHFRNIRGKRDDFKETYPDEGDVDFVKAAMVYREVGYDGMLMPDHVPQHPDDPRGMQAFAFAYGHIRAIIQSLEYIPS